MINVLDMFHGDNREKIPDFAALKAAGIFAVLHKVSQGTKYIDPKFSDRRKAAEQAGMLFGGYHFMDAQDADAQADFFLTAANIADGSGLALACDYEKSASTPALHQAQQFMQNIDHSSPPGTQCILYSGDLIRETLTPLDRAGHISDVMRGCGQFFAMHRLWLAEYGPHENIPWPWNKSPNAITGSSPVTGTKAPGVWLWQFTEKGRINPIVGNVDGNFYSGTADQLASNWLA